MDGANGATLLRFDNPTPAAGDAFGHALAVAGGRIIVGAPSWDGGTTTGVGAVHVFEGATGALLYSLADPRGETGTLFGWSVAPMGENFLVGAPGEGDAYLFEGATGALLLSLSNPELAKTREYFGWAVAGAGGTIVVGQPVWLNRMTGQISSGGLVYVFSESTGEWVGQINDPTPRSPRRISMAHSPSIAASGR